MQGLFWSTTDYGMALMSTEKPEVDKLLEFKQGEVTLEDFLEIDDILQHCSNRHKEVLNILCTAKNVQRMVDYMTQFWRDNLEHIPLEPDESWKTATKSRASSSEDCLEEKESMLTPDGEDACAHYSIDVGKAAIKDETAEERISPLSDAEPTAVHSSNDDDDSREKDTAEAKDEQQNSVRFVDDEKKSGDGGDEVAADEENEEEDAYNSSDSHSDEDSDGNGDEVHVLDDMFDTEEANEAEPRGGGGGHHSLGIADSSSGMAQLFKMLGVMPPPPTYSSRSLLSSMTDADNDTEETPEQVREYKARHKYPMLCKEIVGCEIPQLTDAILENEAVMQQTFDFVTLKPSVSALPIESASTHTLSVVTDGSTTDFRLSEDVVIGSVMVAAKGSSSTFDLSEVEVDEDWSGRAALWRTLVLVLIRRKPQKVCEKICSMPQEWVSALARRIWDESVLETCIALAWDPLLPLNEAVPMTLDEDCANEMMQYFADSHLIELLLAVLCDSSADKMDADWLSLKLDAMNGASYALIDIVAKVQRSPSHLLFDVLCNEKNAKTLSTQIRKLCLKFVAKTAADDCGEDYEDDTEAAAVIKTGTGLTEVEEASLTECLLVCISVLHYFANKCYIEESKSAMKEGQSESQSQGSAEAPTSPVPGSPVQHTTIPAAKLTSSPPLSTTIVSGSSSPDLGGVACVSPPSSASPSLKGLKAPLKGSTSPPLAATMAVVSSSPLSDPLLEEPPRFKLNPLAAASLTAALSTAASETDATSAEESKKDVSTEIDEVKAETSTKAEAIATDMGAVKKESVESESSETQDTEAKQETVSQTEAESKAVAITTETKTASDSSDDKCTKEKTALGCDLDSGLVEATETQKVEISDITVTDSPLLLESSAGRKEVATASGEAVERGTLPIVVELCALLKEVRAVIERAHDKEKGEMQVLGGKCIDLMVALLRDKSACVVQAVDDCGILESCVSALFECPLNNILHAAVEHIIQMILAGDCRALQRKLLGTAHCNLLMRLMAAFSQSAAYKLEFGQPLAFGGHLTRICNTILTFAKTKPFIAELVKTATDELQKEMDRETDVGDEMSAVTVDKGEEEENDKVVEVKSEEEEIVDEKDKTELCDDSDVWSVFLKTELTPINERMNIQLGGDRPMAASLFASTPLCGALPLLADEFDDMETMADSSQLLEDDMAVGHDSDSDDDGDDHCATYMMPSEMAERSLQKQDAAADGDTAADAASDNWHEFDNWDDFADNGTGDHKEEVKDKKESVADDTMAADESGATETKADVTPDDDFADFDSAEPVFDATELAE